MDEFLTNSMETHKENKDFVNGMKAIKERYSYIFDSAKMQDEFEFFKAANAAALEGDYLEKNNFQTTIRGLKVRGSYDSIKEAQVRAQVLKRMDDKFSVFVAEVGCWCPWSPNPEELENQEYAESHLNTLVKKYHDNQKQKDEFFLDRKNKMMEQAAEENKQNLASIVEEIDDQDIWMKQKLDATIENIPTDADVPVDVPTDVATDVPVDVPTDVPVDVPTDVATDVPVDVPTDVPVDVATDVTTADGPVHVPTDGVPDDVPSSLAEVILEDGEPDASADAAMA
jgi:hypothetical protein